MKVLKIVTFRFEGFTEGIKKIGPMFNEGYKF